MLRVLEMAQIVVLRVRELESLWERSGCLVLVRMSVVRHWSLQVSLLSYVLVEDVLSTKKFHFSSVRGMDCLPSVAFPALLVL